MSGESVGVYRVKKVYSNHPEGVATGSKEWTISEWFNDEDLALSYANCGKEFSSGTWYQDDGDEQARAVAGELRDALDDLVYQAEHIHIPGNEVVDPYTEDARAVLSKARGEEKR